MGTHPPFPFRQGGHHRPDIQVKRNLDCFWFSHYVQITPHVIIFCPHFWINQKVNSNNFPLSWLKWGGRHRGGSHIICTHYYLFFPPKKVVFLFCGGGGVVGVFFSSLFFFFFGGGGLIHETKSSSPIITILTDSISIWSTLSLRQYFLKYDYPENTNTPFLILIYLAF